MTREEVIDLLAFARVFDGRVTVGKSETAAWYLALQRVSAGPAQQAVIAHYQVSRERVMPADIIGHVRASQLPIPGPVPAITAAVASPETAARYKAQIAAMAARAAAKFALKDAPEHVPRWQAGMDKRELALAQVEAARPRRAPMDPTQGGTTDAL